MLLMLLFFLMIRRPPRSTLFPYTTLFRSQVQYAAPPLLSQALRRGQADALLTFWQFSARMRGEGGVRTDRKSTRLNSSHVRISYAVFCLKKKTKLSITFDHTISV